MLQIQASEDLELGARQAGKHNYSNAFDMVTDFRLTAAIYFKNCVYKAWDRSRDTMIIEEDKTLIKSNILRALITAPAVVQ